MSAELARTKLATALARARRAGFLFEPVSWREEGRTTLSTGADRFEWVGTIADVELRIESRVRKGSTSFTTSSNARIRTLHLGEEAGGVAGPVGWYVDVLLRAPTDGVDEPFLDALGRYLADYDDRPILLRVPGEKLADAARRRGVYRAGPAE